MLNEDALGSAGGGIRLRPAPLSPPPDPPRSPPSSPIAVRHVDRVSPTQRLAKASSAVRSMESFVNAVASARAQIATIGIADEAAYAPAHGDSLADPPPLVEDELPLHRRRSTHPIYGEGLALAQDTEAAAHRAIREACRQVTTRGWSSRGTGSLLADAQRRLLDLRRLRETEAEPSIYR